VVFVETERARWRPAEEYFLYFEAGRRRDREGIGEKHRSSDMVGPVKLQRFSFSSFSFLA
jgi:hypothetical protein